MTVPLEPLYFNAPLSTYKTPPVAGVAGPESLLKIHKLPFAWSSIRRVKVKELPAVKSLLLYHLKAPDDCSNTDADVALAYQELDAISHPADTYPPLAEDDPKYMP